MVEKTQKNVLTDAERIVNAVMEDYGKARAIDRMDDFYEQPNKEELIDIIDKLIKIIYPGYFRDTIYKGYNAKNHLATLIEDVMCRLHAQIILVGNRMPDMENSCREKLDHEAYRITVEFLNRIPQIRDYLEEDLEASLEGDPAARNFDEIILAYPGLFAITVNRLAHELFLLGVPIIPRIMTEHAHSLTGIDIHPGATIGRHFFIDHGTGIVVGETTVIGDHVKIYQGVTLGALSPRNGQKISGERRHPTIEDNVTIYSGASILGGETVIGHDSIIGSNAFITKSIPAGTRVGIRQQELTYSGTNKTAQKDLSDDTWT